MTQGYSQIALSRVKGKGHHGNDSDGNNEGSASANGFINFQDDDDELVNLEEGRFGSGGGAYKRHADAGRREDGLQRRQSANNSSTSPSSLDQFRSSGGGSAESGGSPLKDSKQSQESLE